MLGPSEGLPFFCGLRQSAFGQITGYSSSDAGGLYVLGVSCRVQTGTASGLLAPVGTKCWEWVLVAQGTWHCKAAGQGGVWLRLRPSWQTQLEQGSLHACLTGTDRWC